MGTVQQQQEGARFTHFSKEYLGIKMQKRITFRIRLEKRKLLTGELKKFDFSSEVFPRFAE